MRLFGSPDDTPGLGACQRAERNPSIRNLGVPRLQGFDFLQGY